MSNYLVDQVADIAARVKELQAEKDEALKGTSGPVTGQEQKDETPSGYGDYVGWGKFGRLEELYQKATKSAHEWTEQFETEIELKSLAHPNWPYANTGFEWRKFVRS